MRDPPLPLLRKSSLSIETGQMGEREEDGSEPTGDLASGESQKLPGRFEHDQIQSGPPLVTGQAEENKEGTEKKRPIYPD